jgi:tetratricopeptide (TPR) repeat protein
MKPVAIAAIALCIVLGTVELLPRAGAATLVASLPRVEITMPKAGVEQGATALRKRCKLAKVMADAAPGSWSRRAQVAACELGLAQLTGSYDTYVDADRSLTEAFRIARRSIDDDAVGPNMLKAQLSYELHRLKPALESLRAPERHAEFFGDEKLLAQITSLRGAVTFARGEYEEGLALLRRSVALAPTVEHKQRLAIALAKVGGVAEATKLLDETERLLSNPRALAWLEFQRAHIDLDRGKRSDARRHLEKAIALYPGYWHAEEHLAELDAEEGHEERAIAAYRSLVERTKDPEFMDQLAKLLAEREPAEAQRLRKRASALYDERLQKLPEATYGHALEHFLTMDPDAQRAVEIATKNRDLRPNGEARTRLAQAYVRAGRVAEARKEMARVLDSKWQNAESFATAAVIFRLAGDEAAASAAEAKATAANPHAMDEVSWLN